LEKNFQNHGPPCSNRLVAGGGGTRQARWREAPRGLSHALVASHVCSCTLVILARMCTYLHHPFPELCCRVSAAACSTDDGRELLCSCRICVTTVRPNQHHYHNQTHTLYHYCLVSTIGHQPTGHFRPRESREQTCGKRPGLHTFSF
jgi:hypothetical protein